MKFRAWSLQSSSFGFRVVIDLVGEVEVLRLEAAHLSLHVIELLVEGVLLADLIL